MFIPGAKAYADRKDVVRIRQVFPEGSVFFPFPHYKVDYVDGDANVVVPWDRIGIEKGK